MGEADWAAQLRGLRETAGVSIAEMARRLGVSRQAVYQMESGRVSPTERTVRRYAEALGAKASLELVRMALKAAKRGA